MEQVACQHTVTCGDVNVMRVFYLAEITGLTYEEVTAMLVGPSGSPVELQIFRDESDTDQPDWSEDNFQREHKIHTVVYLNVFRDVDEIDLRSAEFLSQMLEVSLHVLLRSQKIQVCFSRE